MNFSGENKSSSSTGFRDVRINIWGEKHGPRPKPVGLFLLILLTVIALAGVFPVYQLEAEARDEVDSLEKDLERIEQRIEELSLPLAAEENLESLEAEIVTLEQTLETIAESRGRNTPLFELVMNTLPGQKWLQSIQLSDSSIGLQGDAVTHEDVFAFVRALEDCEEFTDAYLSSMTEAEKKARIVDMSSIKTAALEITELDEIEGEGETVATGTASIDSGLIVAEGEGEEEVHTGEGEDSKTTSIGASITVILGGVVISGASSSGSDTMSILEPPATIKFTATIESYYPLASYTWDFGDGTTKKTELSQPGPTELDFSRLYTYTVEGDYDTVLTVTDIYGTQAVSGGGGIFARANADFTADLPSCADPLTIQFIDRSFAGSGKQVRGYEWDFDTSDEESSDPDFPDVDSTQQNPVYTYEEPGEYVVELTVETTQGNKSIVEKKIKAGIPPEADFNPVPLESDGPLVVRFVDASIPGGGEEEIAAWQWTFGDGQMSTKQNPVHTYASEGPYTVILKVVETDGNCSRATKIIQADNSTEGYFSAQPTGSTLSVAFSAPAGGAPEYMSYQWDFGDDTTGTGQSVTHKYEDVGIYEVSVAIIEMEDTSGSEVEGTVVGATASIEIAKSTSTQFQITVTRAE